MSADKRSSCEGSECPEVTALPHKGRKFADCAGFFRLEGSENPEFGFSNGVESLLRASGKLREV